MCMESELTMRVLDASGVCLGGDASIVEALMGLGTGESCPGRGGTPVW